MRMGLPRVILSDQGREFNNDLDTIVSVLSWGSSVTLQLLTAPSGMHYSFKTIIILHLLGGYAPIYPPLPWLYTLIGYASE